MGVGILDDICPRLLACFNNIHLQYVLSRDNGLCIILDPCDVSVCKLPVDCLLF